MYVFTSLVFSLWHKCLLILIFSEEDEYHLSYRRRVSEIECKFRSFCADAVVVGSNGKLAAEIADGIIIKRDSQFQLNGHASLTVTEIPDALSQNSIHNRSDFILCAPYGIEVSHNTQYSVAKLRY